MSESNDSSFFKPSEVSKKVEENNEPRPQKEQSGNEMEQTTRDIAEITALSMRPELNEKDRLAIRLRYEGKDSASIAEATGFNESYIRRLFMKDGRLAAAYQEFISHQNELLQQVVTAALAKAKEIGLEAIERMVAFSRNDDDRRLGYEATKFLLNLIGISNEVSLKNILRSMSYETASRLVDEAFKDLYGKSFNDGKMTIADLARKLTQEESEHTHVTIQGLSDAELVNRLRDRAATNSK